MSSNREDNNQLISRLMSLQANPSSTNSSPRRQTRDVFGRGRESQGRSRMPMGPVSGSVSGEPIPSQLDRLMAFYRHAYEAGPQIGGMITDRPPTYQRKMAKNADYNAKKNPVYQAKQRNWDTNQAKSVVAKQGALLEAAQVWDSLSLHDQLSYPPELRSQIEIMRTKLRMDQLQREAKMDVLRTGMEHGFSGYPSTAKPIHRW